MHFIDIEGASGTLYRFRCWPASGAHPPIAGNYVLVVRGTRTLLAVGSLDNLSHAPRILAGALSEADLFTRLKISRSPREVEHADIAVAHPDAIGADGRGG
jgi:hypothetical protein